MTTTPTKRDALEALLNEPHKLPLGTFSRLTSSGIPDDGNQALRGQCWLLLLNVLDARKNKDTYQTQLQQTRDNYYGLCEALSKNLDLFSPARSPQCQKQDKALIESAQDVDRTGYGLSFWSQIVPPDEHAQADSPLTRRMFARLHLIKPQRASHRTLSKRLSVTTSSGSSPTNFDSRASSPNPGSVNSTPSVETEPDSRQDQLHRLLFFWALLNPSGYVQGMSELAAVFYFVFASTSDAHQRRHAEADTFNAFSSLLGNTGLMDLFSPAEDGPELSHTAFTPAHGTGLGAVLARLFERISICDPPLASHFKQQGVQPSFFAIKWLTTLFAQSFDIATVLPLWDWLLSQLHNQPPVEQRSQLTPFMEALIDLCTTFVLSLSDRLVDADFALCLGYLQSIECHMPSAVVAAAGSMQEKRLTAPLITDAPAPPRPAASLKMSLRDRLKAAADGAAKQYASFAETDTAANLQKSATNWGIAALSLRDSIGTADRQAVTAKVQNLGSSLNKGWRPASPNADQPFAPPESPGSSSPSTRNSLMPPPKDLEPPLTPRQKPLLLGATVRPSASTSHGLSATTSPLDATPTRSPRLSPSPTMHRRRLSVTPGGGLLGYVPSPGSSGTLSTNAHSGSSGVAYNHNDSPRTLLDDMQMTEDYPYSRRRQASEPVSPSYTRRRDEQITTTTTASGSRLIPMLMTSSQPRDPSLLKDDDPLTSVKAARRQAKRFSIPTRPARSDSLAASFSPAAIDTSFEQQRQEPPRTANAALGLGISDLTMAAPEPSVAPTEEPVLQPPPKRKSKISSSRKRPGSTTSSKASSSSLYSKDPEAESALPLPPSSSSQTVEQDDVQEVLLPPIDDASLSPETARTGSSDVSPGYDSIFDSYH